MRVIEQCYMSNDGKRRIRTETDMDPMDPREDSEPSGTFWAEHRNYKLGDDDAQSDLIEAIQALAKQEGVNINDDDEYIACPNNHPYKDYDAIDLCDLCDDDGEIENPDYNELDTPQEISEALALVDPDQCHIFLLPVYLYDHSGLSLSTGAFSCPWDSGQVGVIFITREKLISEGCYGVNEDSTDEELRNTAHRVLKAEIDTLDKFVSNQVYGFICERLMPCPPDWEPAEWAEHDCHWGEEDSCWGFYGMDILTNGMTEHWDDEFMSVFLEAEGITQEQFDAEQNEASYD